MSTVLEYRSYDEADHCLDDNDALTRYQSEKAANPSALVVLEELHCGEHWKVKVYETERQKKEYFRKRIERIFDVFTGNIEKLQNVEK